MLKYFRCIVLLPLFVSWLGAETPVLVIRGQVKLTAAGAERVVQAAKDRAAVLKVPENIAVVDDGGHLLAFARMDGARPASADSAITKAITAATMRKDTGPVFQGGTQEDATLNLAIEHAAAADGGKLTILYGGVPIVVDGQVIGAVGVGGGSEEQDVSVGKAGVAALKAALSETHSPGSETREPVIRGRIKLTAAGAERVAQAAKERAAALKVAENIAVVDDGGHLLAFVRMDGARPGSVDTAITKAVSAATMRRETGPIFKGEKQEDANLNLAIEHAAAANEGKITILYGGIPIVVDGQPIGAVGVGGGSEEQDVSVGKTGAAALEVALSEKQDLERHD